MRKSLKIESIIEERLSKNTNKNILEKCKESVNYFSSLGYRTLLVGMKIISQKECLGWVSTIGFASRYKSENVSGSFMHSFNAVSLCFGSMTPFCI